MKDFNFTETVIVTGGSGFIGSNFIRHWIEKYPDNLIINLDALTYAGNPDNLRDIEKNKNYIFIKGSITNFDLVTGIVKKYRPDIIINFAAESHNSYAVLNPSVFFKTNVIGTQTLLEVCRIEHVPRFHHISTCEVYGDLPLDSDDIFTEESPYRPRTPYNASKAASDHAVRAYFETYNLPVSISNCSNNYGYYQFPEKIIPLFVTNLIENQKIPLYLQSKNKREWLHVADHCRAIDLILREGKLGETYNIGSGVEKSVEDIAAVILAELGKSENMKVYVKDRPGHDRRYLLDWTKIRNDLGWQPIIDFDKGIKETIKWYKDNRDWWKPLKEKLKVLEEEWGEGKKEL